MSLIKVAAIVLAAMATFNASTQVLIAAHPVISGVSAAVALYFSNLSIDLSID